MLLSNGVSLKARDLAEPEKARRRLSSLKRLTIWTQNYKSMSSSRGQIVDCSWHDGGKSHETAEDLVWKHLDWLGLRGSLELTC